MNHDRDAENEQLFEVPEMFANLYLTPPVYKYEMQSCKSENNIKVVKKKVAKGRRRKLNPEQISSAKKCLFPTAAARPPLAPTNQVSNVVSL